MEASLGYVWDGSAWRRRTKRLIPKGWSNDSSIASNGCENYYISADEGEVWRLENMHLYAPAVSGATSGYHWFRVIQLHSSGLYAVLLSIVSHYNDPVSFHFMRANQATYGQSPETEVAQILAIKSALCDSYGNRIWLQYCNFTNAAQTGTRLYRIMLLSI